MQQKVEKNSVPCDKSDYYDQQHPGLGTQVMKPIHSSPSVG
jgi:hypothetical protein